MILVNTKNLSHEKWLEYRRVGIGGSDAGAICGVSKYRSPIDVWVDKTSDKIEEKDSEAMRVGRDLEDYVAKRFCEATGKKVRRRNAMMAHDTKPWMLANVDREIVGENALLECKTANAYMAKAWEDGKIPESYEIQCHHYMAVTGCDRVYIACLIMGIDFVWRTIERDEETIRLLENIEEDFWKNNVLCREMPAPDGSEAAQKAITERFSASVEETVELDGFVAEIERMDEIETLKKELDTELNEHKQRIMVAMESADTALIGERRITWRTQAGKTTLDTKKLKAEHPEIYERYSKTGKETRVFRWK